MQFFKPISVAFLCAAVALLLIFLGLSGRPGAPFDPGESIVWISPEGMARTGGNAFVVADGVVVSARHVLEKFGQFETPDGRAVTPVTPFSELDYGRATADTTGLPALQLDCDYRPVVGDTLHALSRPTGDRHWVRPWYTEGPVSYVDLVYPGAVQNVVWLVNLPAKPGMSGSPVFRGDRVVGILIAVFRDQVSVGPGMAIPTAHMASVVLPVHTTSLCDGG